MQPVSGKSKLADALKGNPAVLEYIISLNPHDFQRLRNPLMYKVMPPRISLKRIALMVGISECEFVDKINQLNGAINSNPGLVDAQDEPLPTSPGTAPPWMNDRDLEGLTWVDVTSIDAKLGDPMPPINIAVNASRPGQTIAVKHMWEPQPLYDIWHNRGLEFYARQINEDLWHVFIHKPIA